MQVVPAPEWRVPAAAVSAPTPATFSEQAQPQHWKSPKPAPAPAQEVKQVRKKWGDKTKEKQTYLYILLFCAS